MKARVPGDCSIEPTVNWMIKQIVREAFLRLPRKKHHEWISLLGLTEALTKSRCKHSEEKPLVDLNEDKTDEEFKKECLDNLDAITERISGQLGKLCEVMEQIGAFELREIIKLIKIREFQNLTPLPAHYYIAFLAQETLVNEVITTNYDCCLEKAVHYCVGNHSAKQPNSSKAVSIYDLKSYRDKGARRLFPYNMAAVLRVYKINGCATQLISDPNHTASILITERQLQHMNNRMWAKDLLRDRARSRSLVFSGFGSEEPQVRFTVLRLLEEFLKSDSVPDEPNNALWMQIYDNERSFAQNQIMYGFWRNNSNPSDKIEELTFSKKDVPELNKYLGIN